MFLQGSVANFSFTGNDGTRIPQMKVGFSNGAAVDIKLKPIYTNGTVFGNRTNFCIFKYRNKRSSVIQRITVIGCLGDPKDRPNEDLNGRSIVLRAEIDSGWYLQYYNNSTSPEIKTVKFRKYPGKFHI